MKESTTITEQLNFGMSKEKKPAKPSGEYLEKYGVIDYMTGVAETQPKFRPTPMPVECIPV
ncbi:MAG: hypothetical protein OEV93_02125 [Candidatus Moranbacteria bacterium]|nr:hypothetical protein [Candidatus Moranbacteria bacterium]